MRPSESENKSLFLLQIQHRTRIFSSEEKLCLWFFQFFFPFFLIVLPPTPHHRVVQAKEKFINFFLLLHILFLVIVVEWVETYEWKICKLSTIHIYCGNCGKIESFFSFTTRIYSTDALLCRLNSTFFNRFFCVRNSRGDEIKRLQEEKIWIIYLVFFLLLTVLTSLAGKNQASFSMLSSL